MIEHLVVEVRNGKLLVHSERQRGFFHFGSWHGRGTVAVTVTVPQLRGATIAGSGDIRLALEAQRISLAVDGSGDTELSVTADTVTADNHGSGEIAISGETRELDVNLSGSGDFNGFELEAQNARVGVNGSGDANVYVTGELTGSTNGSGDITYDGNPQNVSISENGSGDAGPR
jgi:hypothetical protein